MGPIELSCDQVSERVPNSKSLNHNPDAYRPTSHILSVSTKSTSPKIGSCDWAFGMVALGVSK